MVSSVNPALEERQPKQRLRPALMFLVATTLLLLFGLVLPHGGPTAEISLLFWTDPWVRLGLMAFWLLIVLESLPALLFSWRRPDAGSARLRALLVILIPVLRLAISPHAPQGWIWLPRSGWHKNNPDFYKTMEIRFAIPMLSVAFLIIPVIVVELLLLEELTGINPQSLGLHVLTTFIWAAFCFEFMIMISLADNRWQYTKDHWLNVLIIILPLIAFLRTLLLAKAFQIAKFGKVFQTVRLRAVLTRTHRIMMLLNLLERVLRHFPGFYLRLLRGRESRQLQDLQDTRVHIREMEIKLLEKEKKRQQT